MEARLLAIFTRYSEHIREIVPLKEEEGHLKAAIYFQDGTNLRLNESWEDEQLVEYSYYWLTADNRLKMGWDNAPHHRGLENFPHHKHVGSPTQIVPSHETTLDAVMQVIATQGTQE